MASSVFGGNSAAPRGLTTDVPGAVGATVVVGEGGVVIAGVVGSLGAAAWRTTIRSGEELVGSMGTSAGAVVTGWVEVGCAEVGDVEGGDVEGGDVDGGGFGDVSGGQGCGNRQMIGGNGPIGNRQIGGSGQSASSGTEIA